MCCRSLQRRKFLGAAAGALAAAPAAIAASRRAAAAESDGHGVWAPDAWNPERGFLDVGKKLRVQPVLMYAVAQRREASSWKSWGGIQSEAAAVDEARRIEAELSRIAAQAGFPIEMLPVLKVRTAEDAARARAPARDVTLLYPATGSGGLLRSSVPEEGPAIVFVRHRSGPIYYWYEALSTRYLAPRRRASEAEPPLLGTTTVDDVVVDDPGEILWRLRALRGALGLRGTRIVALGGAWGKYDAEAPRFAAEELGLDIVEVTYESFEPRLAAALSSETKRARAEAWTAQYLSLPGTDLRTERHFVASAFLLYGVIKELLAEHRSQAFTIKDCMRTILPMSRTTACLTLGLLNDEGLLAFCESDFVIIPAGILLRYITGQPVFLHNSTFPHRGIVTCAHCAAPRRMNGVRYEPVKVLTHYESEFGAAPKVEIPEGQEVTFIDPEYATGRWLGFRGRVASNPFYEICRSQQDVEILGDWERLLDEARDSHWIMVYGDHLREAGYAAR
ncbi:MAG: sugar isomerase, partial [Planctomycetes bacterium]|nr:sugar isomerase [Planctomycetota bacterium]